MMTTGVACHRASGHCTRPEWSSWPTGMVIMGRKRAQNDAPAAWVAADASFDVGCRGRQPAYGTAFMRVTFWVLPLGSS